MLFTPVNWKTGKREELNIKTQDIPRRVIKRFVVTESKTGLTYECQTKECSLGGCICDAYIYDYDKRKAIKQGGKMIMMRRQLKDDSFGGVF